MQVILNQKCVCRRGKKDTFIRGEKYFVHRLYQMDDGELMVNVEDKNKWSVNCYARRFLLPNQILTSPVSP